MSTKTMTADEAVTFEHVSAQNAAIVEMACGRGCRAYTDIFTYRRWKALGKQVAKGSHGTKVQTWVIKRNDEGEVEAEYPVISTVFCRHQLIESK